MSARDRPQWLPSSDGFVWFCVREGVTSVEPEEALVAENLLCAVEAVLVHQLSYEGARGALVLHARLHQVDGVDGCGPGG